jgi:hypothetical protein
MNRDLIVCMSRGMSIYALAYVLEYGRDQEFDLVIANGELIPRKAEEFFITLGVRTILMDEAIRGNYGKVFLQPYQSFARHTDFLNQFNFKEISYYSDALRNGMYSLISIDKRVTEFVYFGFELAEKTFLENLDPEQQKTPKVVVSLKSIEEIWIKLSILYGLADQVNILGPDDCLIAMRHWGSSPQYEFLPEKSLGEYLCLEMSNWGTSKRVILKSHPWMKDDESFNRSLKLHFEKMGGSTFQLWEDLFLVPKDFPELGSPESMLWLSKQNLGSFFGFDGSLNTLVKLQSPTTSIQYPNPAIYNNFFRFPSTSNLVLEQIAWQKVLAEEFEKNSRKSKTLVVTSGVPYEKTISRMSLLGVDALTQERDALTQERDALTQERDALTQERDALTQERDALTQERDALKNSTIWRATWPLRKIRNVLKN